MAEPRFVCIVGAHFGQSFTIPQGRAVLGRGSDCDIRVHEDSISRRHVEISFDGTVLLISDLASRNSTRVNGDAIAEKELKNGDVVTLGSIVFRVEWPSKNDVPLIKDDWSKPAKPSLLSSSLLPRIGVVLIMLMFGVGVYLAVSEKLTLQKKDQMQAPAVTMTLHTAVASNDIKAVKENIQAGSDLNRKNESGYTPLHVAALNGETNIVRLLLESGANPHIKANDGTTPAEIAELMKHSDLAKMIREWKPKP